MQKIWYLSPSNQANNVGINGYGCERDQMYRLVLEITPHLDRAGVSFVVPEKDVSIVRRCRQSNEVGAYFHLALHSNAGGSGNAWGPVALYFSKAGRTFGEKLISALLSLGQASNRSYHLKEQKNLYELAHTSAPAALLEVDFHDSAAGVEFITQRRKEIAEAIARVIIEADGREFVPESPSDPLTQATELGLLPQNSDPDACVTNEDLAAIVMKLKALMEKLQP